MGPPAVSTFPLAAAAAAAPPLDPCFQSATAVLSADVALSVADYCGGALVSGCRLTDDARCSAQRTGKDLVKTILYDCHHCVSMSRRCSFRTCFRAGHRCGLAAVMPPTRRQTGVGQQRAIKTANLARQDGREDEAPGDT